MGLFSFLKKAGAALGGSRPETKKAVDPQEANEQKAILLKGIVESHGLEVEDLSVEVNDDQASVYGQVASQEIREKVILALGNVAGIASVDDRLSVVEPAPEAQFYEVKSGDSLSKIAKKYYGSAMKYPVIFEANKPMLSDPNKIYPGQVLRIPPIEN